MRFPLGSTAMAEGRKLGSVVLVAVRERVHNQFPNGSNFEMKPAKPEPEFKIVVPKLVAPANVPVTRIFPCTSTAVPVGAGEPAVPPARLTHEKSGAAAKR